jgi:hypothetical protein
MDGQDGRKRMTIAKREKVQGNGGKADKTYKDGTGAPTASPSANVNLLARMTQSGGWFKCQHLDAGRQSVGSWWELQWLGRPAAIFPAHGSCSRRRHPSIISISHQ